MGRRLLRSLVAVVVLAASLVWPATMTAGAWSSDDWAVAVFGGSGFDIIHSVAVDASGNVYTTGSFQGTADFDPGSGTANLTSNGNADVFVSKLDSSGNYVWAKNLGGSECIQGCSTAAVAVDAL